MQETVVAGISMWSRWQPDRGLNFNSWLVRSDAGAFIVDPLEPDDARIFALCREAGVATVIITNRDHERAAALFARELGARVIAPAADAAQLTVAVDGVLADGEHIFGWRALALDGYKTPGETVLYSHALRTAISGDAFWGAPAGSLRLMPDEKLADPQAALLSARRLRALPLDHVLVGDGMPVFGNAQAVLGAMIDRRAADAPVQIVNLADLRWERDIGDPAPFQAEAAEIGMLLGAQRLGVAAGRLPPGTSYCPLHWHTREEELFVVWEGTPLLRTPAGTRRLTRGDWALFATSPDGAHRLTNDTDRPCVVVMIAAVDGGDVCFYPDSDKLLVEAVGTMVRAAPQLSYFAGE